MNKPIIKLTGFALAMLLLPFWVNAQRTADSAARTTALVNAINFFNTGVGKQSKIYNGKEFTEYDINIKDNPFFGDEAIFRPASVKFDGYIYNNVPVKYDLYRDQLVALYFNKASSYVLAPEGVSSFSLQGHNFKYIAADSVDKGPGAGYYEQLFGGKVSALAKYSKTLQTNASNAGFYFTKTAVGYYIQKGNQILSFNSQGSLLAVLKDRKKELQQYIKTNNIDFKKDRVQAITSITAYYNRINN